MSVELFEVRILEANSHLDWCIEDNFTSQAAAEVWARDNCDGRRWVVRGMRSGAVYSTDRATRGESDEPHDESE